MKRTRPKLLLATGLTALGLNLTPQSASAATTSGVMTGNETWSGTVTLTGDVTVPNNVTLTILPGTRVACWDKYDDQAGGINSSRIELIIDQGSLNAVGTSNAPILFTSSPNVPPAHAGDWQGIRLRSGTNASQIVQWAIIEFAIDGVRVETGSPTIDQCIFRTNQTSGLYFISFVTPSNCWAYGNGMGFKGGSGSTGSFLTNCIAYANGEGIYSGYGLVLSHCVSTNNTGSGISAEDLDASYCLSARNGAQGVYGVGNQRIKVDYCTIVQNQGFGIVCNYGFTEAYNSTIVSNSGSGLRGSGGAINFLVVSNCVISYNSGFGLDLSQSVFPSSVLSSVISYNGRYGILSQSADLTLQDCSILNNGEMGVLMTRPGSGGIVRNRIQGSQVGLRVNGGNDLSNITGILSNTITLNTQYDFYNSGPAAVIATYNFWGEPTTTELTNNLRNLTKIYDSQDDSKVGQVVLKPYLTNDPFALPPQITSQPADVTVAAGTTATFTASATSASPLSYQWRKGTSSLLGQTNSFLSFTAQVSDAATNYNVVVSNSDGSTNSRWATLTVLFAPAITSQPTNLFLPPGTAAAFHVTASGSAPLSYQWQKEGVNLANVGRVSGATSPDLTITSIQASDAGNYRVVVANTVGTVPSSVATLDLLEPPSITQNPITQVVGVGGPATFTVAATGSSPLNYQWYLNGSAINGATNASFTIPTTSAAWLGSYQVQVWNSAGPPIWSATAGLWLDTLKMYAGVNVYGPAGSNCVVQYATNLTAPVTWIPLQSVIIVTNPTVIIDYASPEQPKRFYRTLPQ